MNHDNIPLTLLPYLSLASLGVAGVKRSFPGAKRSFPGVKHLFPGVKRSFHGAKISPCPAERIALWRNNNFGFILFLQFIFNPYCNIPPVMFLPIAFTYEKRRLASL